jgi:hypothetical protein
MAAIVRDAGLTIEQFKELALKMEVDDISDHDHVATRSSPFVQRDGKCSVLPSILISGRRFLRWSLLALLNFPLNSRIRNQPKEAAANSSKF